MVLDHPEVADKLLKSNAKVTFDNYYDKHTIRPGGNTAHKLLTLLALLPLRALVSLLSLLALITPWNMCLHSLLYGSSSST